MKWLKCLFLVFFLFGASFAYAEDPPLNAEKPLERAEDLTKDYNINSVKRIESARIVYVDYELIRRDFPAVKNLSNPEIDEWLLNNTAFMASTQVSQDKANSNIRVTEETRVAYRPEDYGRALIFQAEAPEGLNSSQNKIKQFMAAAASIWEGQSFQEIPDEQRQKMNALLESIKEEKPDFYRLGTEYMERTKGGLSTLRKERHRKKLYEHFKKMDENSRSFIGLIDAKGVGAVLPRAGDHSDGLMSLGEAIREFAYEKMVNRIFIHEGANLKTVGSYAVIDGGYAVKHADGSSSPAGIILRQAHARDLGPSSTMSDEVTVKVERLLRKYGLTSAGAYRDKYNFDKLNVQGTDKGAIIDFGGFLAVEDYSGRDASHFFRPSKVLLKDSGPDAIKPDPNLRVPLEQWGSAVDGVEDPKMDKPWNWSHELARNFAEGRATRDDAYNHLRNMWGPFFNKLEQTSPRGPRRSCLVNYLLR